MASPTPRRPVPMPSTTMARGRQYDNSPGRTPPSAAVASGHGIARTSSFRSRPIHRSLASPGLTQNSSDEGEGSKSVNAQLIADLQEQVERAEQASEQYRRQLEAVQKRFDEATDEQTAAEERDFATKSQIDRLQADVKDDLRRRREMEFTFESERALMLQEREKQVAREVELQTTVNRLNETLKTKNLEHASTARLGKANSMENVSAYQSSSQQQEHDQLIQDRDGIIETLKLELADAHIKLAEIEHTDNGNFQSLERQTRDLRMQNARLVEENDSFQMLLSQQTIQGRFASDHVGQTETVGGTGSLADEMQNAELGERRPTGGPSGDVVDRLEAEVKTVKDENKALTLYIDKIIGRLLHEGLEHIITGKQETDDFKEMPLKSAQIQKPLPAPPPMDSSSTSNGASTGSMPPPASVPMSFLQRARSVVAKPGPARARPQSYMPSPASVVSNANENPQTAPSIPINRGHRRVRSDQTQADLGAAPAVQQSNRGSPLRSASGGVQAMSPPQRASTSHSQPPPPPPFALSGRTPSTSVGQSSSGNSVVSEHSLDRERPSFDGSSAPTSTHGNQAPGAAIPGAVMKQNQLRPLRLVREQTEADEEARRRANRGSWMGWFQKGSVEAQNV